MTRFAEEDQGSVNADKVIWSSISGNYVDVLWNNCWFRTLTKRDSRLAGYSYVDVKDGDNHIRIFFRNESIK